MKKILIASSLAALSAMSTTASATAFTTGNVATINNVTSANCTLLNADIKINSSASNVGSYICNGGTANIGVAFGNTAGKNHVYSATSAGGSLTDTTTSAAPTSTNTEAAATAGAASS